MTCPDVGLVTPPSSLINVDLPAPEGPITAVRVPGRASNETLVSSWWPSMARPTWRTSMPPVATACRDWTVVPPVNTRSVLPMVMTSPGRRVTASTRWPLTKVPLPEPLSYNWVPVGAGTR
ncbi:Uncharacterised protein [Mycobacteroides abscessus subsp. abscessus]|nr:Uncharacterised protein [Mycobacteroides abscessus subsp. abscessus]